MTVFPVDFELGKQPDREVFRVADGKPDDEVEGAFGTMDDDARESYSGLRRGCRAPFLVFLPDGREIIPAHIVGRQRALSVSTEGGQSRAWPNLSNRLHDLLVPGNEGPDPRPTAAEPLGDRIDDDDPIVDIVEFEKAGMRSAVVDEFLVDLVADKERDRVF